MSQVNNTIKHLLSESWGYELSIQWTVTGNSKWKNNNFFMELLFIDDGKGNSIVELN